MSPADIAFTKNTGLCAGCHSSKLIVKNGWVCCDNCGAKLYRTEAP